MHRILILVCVIWCSTASAAVDLPSCRGVMYPNHVTTMVMNCDSTLH